MGGRNRGLPGRPSAVGRRLIVCAIAAQLGAFGPASAGRAAPDPSPEPARSASAPELVREGNRLLLDEKPVEALERYELAETARPDAHEIDFVRGLGRFKLGEYDQARRAFREAALSPDPTLQNDAEYSVGTCDHAEALAGGADPQAALAKLESAMRAYQNVLARDPQHAAARESNLKAAYKWRQIKQQLQQQQQQQSQPSQDQESEPPDDEQQADEQEQQEPDDQQRQNEQPRQQEEQDQQQQQQAQSDQQSDDQQQASSQTEQQDMQQVSREQAERRLREMIQALKDREKLRREFREPVPIRPAEKDW